MRNWLEPPSLSPAPALSAAVGGHPLVAQVLQQRGISDPAAARAFLSPDDYTPCAPEELPDLEIAVERLVKAIQSGETICVWGDFDVDGQTSTALLVQTLQELGGKVIYHIPVRETESHGVNLPVLTQFIEQGTQLILTCDTGVSSHAAADFARSKGVDFLITDHHDLPEKLPDALAVVNPKRIGQSNSAGQHPLSTLPGVGVAYKLAEALYQRFGRAGEALKHADLAALGIVADVAIQTGEARYLVQRGLEILRQTEAEDPSSPTWRKAGLRVGLQSMLESADIKPAWLSETHIGFGLGPRLNALGRLADANLCVELLTTQDLRRARVLAYTLEDLNSRRQLLTSQVFQAAQAQIEREPELLESPVLVLSQPAWPAGVIGIVASRLVDHYHRPVILISCPPGVVGRGSARSVEGVNITALLADQRNLLENFGGHPMAAGFAIRPENIPALLRGLERSFRRLGFRQEVETTLQLDGYLTLNELSLELVEDLQRLAPFGPGNPPLVLAARNLKIKSHAPVGRTAEHLQLIVEDEAGNRSKVLWWQGVGLPLPQGRFDLAFTVHASNYRGLREVQVEWVDGRALPAIEGLQESLFPPLVVQDYRQSAQPLAALKHLLEQDPSLQVWREADAKERLEKAGVSGHTRQELIAAPRLVIWTTPTGRAELNTALQRVAPQTVYLFARDPVESDINSFLRRLAGLAKYVQNQQAGQTDLSWLAAATGQRKTAVRLGLEWLAERGEIAFSLAEEEKVCLSRGQQTPGNAASAERLHQGLKKLLDETAAFRDYFRKAAIEGLLG